jgi:hypothetical protein
VRYRWRDYAISTITIEWSEIPASRSTCEYRQELTWGVSEGVAKAWSRRNPETAEQMRRIGARGGKTQARNRRACQRAAGAAPRETPLPAAPPLETTPQAMAVLDAQFAWLRGAEKRHSRPNNCTCGSPCRWVTAWIFPLPHLFPPVPTLGYPAHQPLIHHLTRRRHRRQRQDALLDRRREFDFD